MKSINFFLVITALFLTCTTGFAQSAKDNSKAIKSTDKIDSQLKSENPALALSDSQRKEIIALQMEYIKELSGFSKDNPDKAVVKTKSKELRKIMTAKISEEIFTPEQAKAQKAARKNMKGKKGEGVAKTGKKSKKATGKKQKAPIETITVAEADKIYASATAKQKSKAEKATAKMNASITASDANLALSADQKKQINALYVNRLLEREKMEKAGVAKDQIKIKSKEFNKSNNQMIRSILTKEQNAILKASKKNKKKK